MEASPGRRHLKLTDSTRYHLSTTCLTSSPTPQHPAPPLKTHQPPDCSLSIPDSLPPQDVSASCSHTVPPDVCMAPFFGRLLKLYLHRRAFLDGPVLNYSPPLLPLLPPSDPVVLLIYFVYPPSRQGLLSVLLTAPSAASGTVPGMERVLSKYLWNE